MALTRPAVRAALTTLAQSDRRVERALGVVGFPPGRRRPHGFATLLRIIVGQQVSVKAAAAIYGRLEDSLGGDVTPERLLRVRVTTLRKVGLSGRKVEYAQSLARAVCNGRLDLKGLRRMDDEDALAVLTALRGFGVWSGQMYLMAALGRMDVWPVGDVGVQAGVQRMLQLPERPKPAQLEPLGEAWRPYRSAVALLAWHYLHNAPL